jgi:hypothetical protein
MLGDESDDVAGAAGSHAAEIRTEAAATDDLLPGDSQDAAEPDDDLGESMRVAAGGLARGPTARRLLFGGAPPRITGDTALPKPRVH